MSLLTVARSSSEKDGNCGKSAEVGMNSG
jgi:hypothetical protein